MGKGKARRRRQANYEASHSSRLALAPPPSKKDVNAVPSKLRQIMKFMATGTDEQTASSHKATGADEQSRKTLSFEKKEGGSVFKSQAEQQKPSNDSDKTLETSESKPKKKRKRSDNSIVELLGEQSNTKKGMRERRKSYLKDKKEKKKRNKKQKQDDDDGGLKRLYQHEAVPFGEVVDAPPKLPKLRKAPNKDDKKPGLRLSEERIRLQAVEAYRKKRGWESRPGLKISV